MGAAGTGRFRPFQRDDTLAGMGKLTLVVARNLHLKNLELDRLHHEFTKFLEKDNRTCLIRIEDVFRAYKVEFGHFASLFFQLYDKTKSGEMDFCQFVLVMWSLLTADQDHIASMCFSLFDNERSGAMDIAEVNLLVGLVWEFRPPDEVRMALKHLNKNADSIVTVAEFALLVRYYPFIVQVCDSA